MVPRLLVYWALKKIMPIGHEKFTSWLSAMNLNFIIPTEKRYANGLDTSGYLDQSLVPSVVSHPITLRLWPILNQDQDVITSSTLIENGLNLIWDIMEPTGIIRSHTQNYCNYGNYIR